MPRPAAVPLRSNLVTGRSAQRSTTPPAQGPAGPPIERIAADVRRIHHQLLSLPPGGAGGPAAGLARGLRQRARDRRLQTPPTPSIGMSHQSPVLRPSRPVSRSRQFAVRQRGNASAGSPANRFVPAAPSCDEGCGPRPRRTRTHQYQGFPALTISPSTRVPTPEPTGPRSR
jgi:hypothetical protein